MMNKQLSIIVCGDLDCGKSTLIGRLLFDTQSLTREIDREARKASDFNFAYLLDSLQEEREGQFTLDTTQAFLKYKKRQYILIDVPGHRELLKNMLTGASYADIAILVIDAQKSIQEQSKRHAFILKFLGIKELILALNKMDVVDYGKDIFEKLKNEIINFFHRKDIEPKYFIPVSAKYGENLLKKSKKMPWYKGPTLLDALDNYFSQKSDTAFRFPIQDIYNLNGKRVAVGIIISGKLKVGEKVRVMPLGKDCKIEAIKVFKRNMHFAKVPESIGLILDNMQDLGRGKVICKSPFPSMSKAILSKIFCVYPVDIRQKLRFQCATQEVSAWISETKSICDTADFESIRVKNSLLPVNCIAELIISTEKPVIVENFKGTNSLGRFILKNDKDICAIGVVS